MPSPKNHIYRLVLVLIVAGAGFVGLKRLATPDSWDYQAWFRRDALPQLQQQAVLYGGNPSCGSSTCHQSLVNHQDKLAQLQGAAHDGLACEGCHGPLAEHARDDRKVADAQVDRDNGLCLSCHGRLLGRLHKVAEFDPAFNPMHKMMETARTTRCGNCHNPHAPAPKRRAAGATETAVAVAHSSPDGDELSCQGGGCHQSVDSHRLRFEQLQGAVHKDLSCETCHGAMASHAAAGAKIADAPIRRDSSLCLMCHGGTPRPDQPVRQFDPEFKIHQAAKVTRETPCTNCHNPHAPK